MLEIRDLVKTYRSASGDLPVLTGIDFVVKEGEFVSLMGPSGSGKSTLLNLLGCLDRPTAGDYRLEGRSLVGLSDEDLSLIRSRRIGFVFQSFNLLPQSTVLANVELPSVYARIPKEKRTARAKELLGRVGLSGRYHHRPTQLSGGEQQRVAIARSLMNQPAVLLADEPTGNLDSKTGTEIMALIQDVNRSGVTILMVTHDPRIVQYTSRAIRMRDGRVERDEQNEKPLDAREVPLT